MSKIKKIRAIWKNWEDRGVRLSSIGINPHSKGDLFENCFILIEKNTVIRSIEMAVVRAIKEANFIIVVSANH